MFGFGASRDVGEHANMRKPWEKQAPGLGGMLARVVSADLTNINLRIEAKRMIRSKPPSPSVESLRSDIRPGPVKCLLHGWEFAVTGVTPERILAHADQFDKLPSSGIAVYLNRELSDGSRLSDDTVMSSPHWTYENLAPFIPALREFPKHRGLRDSMISLRCTSTNRIDWTDDAAWSRVGDNISTIA